MKHKEFCYRDFENYYMNHKADGKNILVRLLYLGTHFEFTYSYLGKKKSIGDVHDQPAMRITTPGWKESGWLSRPLPSTMKFMIFSFYQVFHVVQFCFAMKFFCLLNCHHLTKQSSMLKKIKKNLLFNNASIVILGCCFNFARFLSEHFPPVITYLYSWSGFWENQVIYSNSHPNIATSWT